MTLPLDRHWKNVSWLLPVEVFYGVALALISMVAVLPVFLSRLGATNAVIGALPVIWLLATSFPGAFAAHFTGGLAHRKRAVIILHLLAGIPWLILAAWFGVVGRPSATADIVALLAGWGASWIIMGFTIPVWIRRLVTMLPAVLVALIGLDPTRTLVISQVVLSFALPLPVITLVMFTRRRDLMGSLVNKAITTWAAIACSGIILSLNIWLLYSTFAPLFGWWLPG